MHLTDDIIRRHLKQLPAYVPIEPFDVLSTQLGIPVESIIKMDANENPYGPSPAVRAALGRLEFPHIYPDPESRALRSALSEFTGVPDRYILAGSGADELIDLTMRLLLDPGDYVLNCPPTFGMYSFDTLLNAGKLIDVPRNEDFSLDLSAIRQAVDTYDPKILFLANPNNPDGSMLSDEVIDSLLNLPLLIVLDEAYIEFSRDGGLGELATRISQVSRRDNLIVLRTFSKWAGLAGLRVGYGAFPEWLLTDLWKAKQPYNVNVAASVAAIASLQDHQYLAGIVQQICSERGRISRALQQLEWLYAYPSEANFILCRVIGRDAAELKSTLATKYGILVRYFNTSRLQDHIRISVGRPQDTDAIISALIKESR